MSRILNLSHLHISLFQKKDRKIPHVGFLEKGVSLRLFHPFCPDRFQSITHNRVPRNQPTLKVEPGNFPGEDAGLPVATISPKRVGESTGNQLGARAGGNLGDKVMS